MSILAAAPCILAAAIRRPELGIIMSSSDFPICQSAIITPCSMTKSVERLLFLNDPQRDRISIPLTPSTSTLTLTSTPYDASCEPATGTSAHGFAFGFFIVLVDIQA
jgi:hypothetical protein